jgi:acyl-CoA synthetase (AMP-forming)/AMP-acid ligase II
VPRDDKTSGEVLVRGPCIAGSYVGGATPERWTADGFFRTGDVARQDEHGFVQLTDAPGYGVEVDMETARRYLAKGESLWA